MSVREAGLAVLGLVALVVPVQAGPPLTTNDPEIAPYRKFEVNTPYQLELSSGGTQFFLPSLDINYGLTKRIQLTVENGFLFLRPVNAAAATGLTDQTVGIKYQIVKSKHHDFIVTVNPEISFPTGNAALGLGLGGMSYDTSLLAQYSFGKKKTTTVYGQVAYEVQTAQGIPSHFFFGIAVDQTLGKKLHLLGEIYANQVNEPIEPGARGSVLWSLGATYELKKDKRSLLFSAGRAFQGDPTLTVYFGPQFVF